MHIGFIEDTKLNGGTQLWVFDAIYFFLEQDWSVTLITPQDGWLAKECLNQQLTIKLVLYDFENIVTGHDYFIQLWTKALAECDIAICTVHPPRNGFHCSMFGAMCINKSDLKTKLLIKAGTVIPAYLKEYYLPPKLENSSIIAISKITYKSLINLYDIPEQLITHIYQGIDLNYFNSDSKSGEKSNKFMSQFQKSRPIIGCIGSLLPRKGQDILLEVLSTLVEKIPSIHLLIVGDGPDEVKLKKKVQDLALQDKITFIPFTRDILQIFEVIDILTLPSLAKEGLPNVILEAFAMKIPVVASNLGGISEVVKNGKTGYLIAPGNVYQLVEAILKIWESQERYQSMQEAANNLVKMNHDRKEQMKIFKAHFKYLIQNKQSYSSKLGN